jgi:copper chaperone
MTETFTVRNVKCGGCAANIRKGLGALPGVDTIEVEVQDGRVTVTGTHLSRAELSAKLAALGYPEAP